MKQLTKNKTYKIVALFVFLLVLLDQVTKKIIVYTMDEGDSIEVIKDFFALASHRNTGASFGMLPGAMTSFYIITAVALVLFYFFIQEVDLINKKFYSYGVVLMIGGTIGNFIDRVLYQEVVDFLDFLIFGYDFAIFNVADICLTVGVALFTIDIIFFDAKRPINNG